MSSTEKCSISWSTLHGILMLIKTPRIQFHHAYFFIILDSCEQGCRGSFRIKIVYFRGLWSQVKKTQIRIRPWPCCTYLYVGFGLKKSKFFFYINYLLSTKWSICIKPFFNRNALLFWGGLYLYIYISLAPDCCLYEGTWCILDE